MGPSLRRRRRVRRPRRRRPGAAGVVEARRREPEHRRRWWPSASATRWSPRSALARGRLYAPLPTTTGAGRRWPSQVRKTLRLDDERFGPRPGPPTAPSPGASWGLALLSAVPVGTSSHPARATAPGPGPPGGHPLHDRPGRRPPGVRGTHMSHITHGSHAQYRRLAQQLPPLDAAGLLAGDMNMWGPPASSYFRGWRRAVPGRTLARPPTPQPARPRAGHPAGAVVGRPGRRPSPGRTTGRWW